jgi:CTP synthase
LVLASCPVDNSPEDAPRLWGGLKIKISSDSLAYQIYKEPAIEETFSCNYEFNLDYRQTLETNGLKVSGVSEDGGARIIELPDHRFFIATGFVPQYSSQVGKPHPLIVAFLQAAWEYGESRHNS